MYRRRAGCGPARRQELNPGAAWWEHARYYVSDRGVTYAQRGVTRELCGVNPARRHVGAQSAGSNPAPRIYTPIHAAHNVYALSV